MRFYEPGTLFDPRQTYPPAPDDDAGEAVRLRLCRTQQLNQMGNAAASSDVGRVDTYDHDSRLPLPTI